jgi:hypothetical protein
MLHADFRKFRWTKPVKQICLFAFLMLVGIGISVWRHDYAEAGFFAVMMVAASGPFIYLYRSVQKELKQFAEPASLVWERVPAIPVRLTLLEFVENRLRVEDAKLEDHANERLVVARVLVAEGHHKPAYASEVEATAKIDETEKIAIVETNGYRAWCRISEVSSTRVPSLPPLDD